MLITENVSMGKIEYKLQPVEEGFVAQCTVNPMVTVFGKTPTDARNNLVQSILAYIKMYPDKRDHILNPTIEVDVEG